MGKQKKLLKGQLFYLDVFALQLYPSIQAKVWGNIGKLPELLDVVLDSFIKVSIENMDVYQKLYLPGL